MKSRVELTAGQSRDSGRRGSRRATGRGSPTRFEYLRELMRRDHFELRVGAVLRPLVGAPAAEVRHVAEAVALVRCLRPRPSIAGSISVPPRFAETGDPHARMDTIAGSLEKPLEGPSSRSRRPSRRRRCPGGLATDNREETDRYWNAIVGNGGKESECGWCKDRWGLSWQITPRTLTEAMAAGGDEASVPSKP
jgi:hypothetical protein